MTDFSSDLPAVDAYLADGFDTVRGMSSRFSATVSAWLMGHQTRNGVTGGFAEIGALEGRFFIPMAKALAPGERALGIDVFEWPDAGVLDRFKDNCARHDVGPDDISVHKGRSFDLTAADDTAALSGPVRLWHIDGEHSRDALNRDLDLAYATLAPGGLIVCDDMLHPEYPLLVVGLFQWLERHLDMKVVLAIDREDIVAAAKFVLCRAEDVALYENELMRRFAAQHYTLGSEWERYFCVVLTKEPRIADVG
jgi:predicted O-methyltransferase YrrM